MRGFTMFKVGDTVQLKSGGPIMTVTEVGTMHGNGKPAVWVTWFWDNKVERDHFPPEALQAYTESNGDDD
jgi:uncharacterized protein YodC (DUF2158 family)